MMATFVFVFIAFVQFCVSGTDPCQGNKICGKGTKCISKGDGGEDFHCYCQTGFENKTEDVNQRFTCMDTDECVTKTSCLAVEECVNTYGAYHCDCIKGFAHQDGKCRDIDECAEEGACGAGQCNNTYGSYVCECKDGHVMEGTPCEGNRITTTIVAVTVSVVGLLAIGLVLGALVLWRRKSPSV